MSKQATRILVVDDERFFREVIGEVLERAGIPYATAESGAEALTAVQDPAIGVAVLSGVV